MGIVLFHILKACFGIVFEHLERQHISIGLRQELQAFFFFHICALVEEPRSSWPTLRTPLRVEQSAGADGRTACSYDWIQGEQLPTTEFISARSSA